MPVRLLVAIGTVAALLAAPVPAHAASDMAVVSLTAAPNPVATASDFTVTIVVENRGDPTRYAGIMWTPPEAASYSGFECPPGFSQSPDGPAWCQFGYLATGEQATMRVFATIDTPGTFTHSVSVSPVPDADASNDRMSATITVTGAPPRDGAEDRPSDRPGGGGPGTGTPGTGGQASSLVTALSLSAPSLRHGGRITVRYTLARAAVAVFTVERARSGRRVGGRCVAATPARRGRPACTRWVRVPGSIVRTGQAGANSLAFTGRMAGRALGAGAYRLTARAQATDASGRRSVRFRIAT